MFHLAFLSLFVFVCEQLHIKTADRIFMNILPQMYLWTGRTYILEVILVWIQGFFEGFFNIAR